MADRFFCLSQRRLARLGVVVGTLAVVHLRGEELADLRLGWYGRLRGSLAAPCFDRRQAWQDMPRAAPTPPGASRCTWRMYSWLANQ